MTDSYSPLNLPGTGWHHEDVKAELRKKFGSLTVLSRQLGVTRQSISNVLTNPLASARLERKIAQMLQVPPYAIWPMRWRPDGMPISRSDRSKYVRIIQKQQENAA
ncbi:helix-turn-helix domain-containing protein [Acidocella sp.]|uniref:helix-turn-helix domain-containing protein n=1 Tax=Acidocella sp. TaxID=50710 RepID=UPI0026308CF6|nr:helix-turn-helix domain-containing protein [Acidocella sp.]